MESKKTRERLRLLNNGYEGPIDEGIIGEVIVYLVVFREGICTVCLSSIPPILLLTHRAGSSTLPILLVRHPMKGGTVASLTSPLEHTDYVRNKILTLSPNTHMSSGRIYAIYKSTITDSQQTGLHTVSLIQLLIHSFPSWSGSRKRF